jgi:serine/threonine protein kinase
VIGKTISHYKILDKLGGGGMGVVYKAEDTKLRRTVALKFLPLELTGDPEAKRRFINEAQAASSLQHHNICTIHEIDETPDGQLFICMDCYEGDTLKKRIEGGPVPLDQVVDIGTQVAEGLRKAHEAGVVHRDIKPANILVTPDGVVKILDFGLAKLADETRLTQTGSTVGTPAYMSPEQVRGTDADHRTDIWSLGAVMHEMIAGRLPFAGDHVQALLYSILNEEPESLSDTRPEISAELENVVKNALQKNPEDRYASADRMLADLGKISSRTQAPRAKTSDKSWRWAAIAALLIAASVFLYPHITGRVGTTKASGSPSSEQCVS